MSGDSAGEELPAKGVVAYNNTLDEWEELFCHRLKKTPLRNQPRPAVLSYRNGKGSDRRGNKAAPVISIDVSKCTGKRRVHNRDLGAQRREVLKSWVTDATTNPRYAAEMIELDQATFKILRKFFELPDGFGIEELLKAEPLPAGREKISIDWLLQRGNTKHHRYSAIYFLISKTEFAPDGTPKVYIGQAEDLRIRLLAHKNKKSGTLFELAYRRQPLRDEFWDLEVLRCPSLKLLNLWEVKATAHHYGREGRQTNMYYDKGPNKYLYGYNTIPGGGPAEYFKYLMPRRDIGPKYLLDHITHHKTVAATSINAQHRKYVLKRSNGSGWAVRYHPLLMHLFTGPWAAKYKLQGVTDICGAGSRQNDANELCDMMDQLVHIWHARYDPYIDQLREELKAKIAKRLERV